MLDWIGNDSIDYREGCSPRHKSQLILFNKSVCSSGFVLISPGFVPRNQYVGLGAVFTTACNRSIDDHMTLNNHERRKQQDLLATTRAFPQLQALNHDPDVRNHLVSYRDTHPNQPILAGLSTTLDHPDFLGGWCHKDDGNLHMHALNHRRVFGVHVIEFTIGEQNGEGISFVYRICMSVLFQVGLCLHGDFLGWFNIQQTWLRKYRSMIP